MSSFFIRARGRDIGTVALIIQTTLLGITSHYLSNSPTQGCIDFISRTWLLPRFRSRRYVLSNHCRRCVLRILRVACFCQTVNSVKIQMFTRKDQFIGAIPFRSPSIISSSIKPYKFFRTIHLCLRLLRSARLQSASG